MKLIQGNCLDVLKKMESESVNCCVSSPPYWALRDYGVKGQLGIEDNFDKYISDLCDIYEQVKRVLTNDGTCWVNVGDTYSSTRWSNKPSTTGVSRKCSDIVIKKDISLPDKCLCQIPSRFAIEMCTRGWILRNELIWYKPNAMPSSVKDRFTVDFEKLFFFTKNKKYFFNQQLEDMKSGSLGRQRRGVSKDNKWVNGPDGQTKHTMNQPRKNDKNRNVRTKRNKRCVWKINLRPFKDAHFAVFPQELIETPIKSGCPTGGIVLDPFMGSGTTGVVAKKLGMEFIGIDLNPEYINIAKNRINEILI